MIFNTSGVPIREVLLQVALARNEAEVARKRRAGKPTVLCEADGTPIYRILKDKLGDAYRVFRAVLKHTGKYDGAKLRELRKTR